MPAHRMAKSADLANTAELRPGPEATVGPALTGFADAATTGSSGEPAAPRRPGGAGRGARPPATALRAHRSAVHANNAKPPPATPDEVRAAVIPATARLTGADPDSRSPEWPGPACAAESDLRWPDRPA